MPRLTTIILAPATEVLVQIESRRTVSKFYVGEPFRDNVEKRRVHADRRTYQGDNYPALSGVVCLPEFIPEAGFAASAEEACVLTAASLSSSLFSCRILHPVLG